ncbi:putative Bgh-specific protein [Blumeria hordei DH14]|uniref:Putative Bgh-specific protein n=1 Tax=Blumeria graminis f. sp. hordei (strain DH14) TaxID=546991 RepID=N1J606_BLUG1|nr:putative Bgh-specific protein [Blumeria hordei DH14]
MSTMKLTGWEGMLSVSPEQDRERKTTNPEPVARDAIKESDQAVKRELLTPFVNDIAGPVSEAYHSARFAHAKSSVSIVKQEITIRYRLNDDQIAAINLYAKEYNIRYLNRDRHDHAAAAAMRIIDHKLIASRIPNGVRVSDVGGNPLYHIAHANSHVHVCGHVHDKKDQMRNVMRLQAVKKKTMDSKVAVANMAAKYLERDKSFVCFEDARFCLHPTPILTSVHVYDIPLDH